MTLARLSTKIKLAIPFPLFDSTARPCSNWSPTISDHLAPGPQIKPGLSTTTRIESFARRSANQTSAFAFSRAYSIHERVSGGESSWVEGSSTRPKTAAELICMSWLTPAFKQAP